MMDVISPVALGTAAVGVITGAGILLRRISRDKLELAKDRAEEGIIEHLTSQRDRAVSERDELRQELKTAMSELDKSETKSRELLGEVSRLNIHIKILTSLVNRLSQTLEESKEKIEAAVESVRSANAFYGE